ncbi:TPA: hypothetical protein ACH3X1_007236 [Trebouxia sp. C0004]
MPSLSFAATLRHLRRRVCYGLKQGGEERAPSHGESASETLRQECTKIWGAPGCMPFAAQPDTATLGIFAYGSGRRRMRERNSQIVASPPGSQQQKRYSPREGRTQRPVGRRAGDGHWHAFSHVKPCDDAEARLGCSFELHGTDSWQTEAYTDAVLAEGPSAVSWDKFEHFMLDSSGLLQPATEIRTAYDAMVQSDYDTVSEFVREFRLKERELIGTPYHPGGSAIIEFIKKLTPAVRKYGQDNAPEQWWADVKQTCVIITT